MVFDLLYKGQLICFNINVCSKIDNVAKIRYIVGHITTCQYPRENDFVITVFNYWISTILGKT